MGRRNRWRTLLGGALLVAALAGCVEDEPGLDPGVDTDGDAPAVTSDTLGQCPPGGPDETTPPAGCLGADGQVLRP